MEQVVVAVDLGGTHLRTAVCTLQGSILARAKIETQVEKGADYIVRCIAELVERAIADTPRERILGIGIAAPGPLDPRTGIVIQTPNLIGFEDYPLRERLAELTGLPTVVENDANAAAVGEHRFGAGRGYSHLVYLTISTGIGGGIIVDNRLLWGSRGLAGEVGHMTVEPHGPRCNCGNIGCLETLASGPAIARHAREAVLAGQPTTLLDLTPGRDPDSITAQIVTEAAAGADTLALDILTRAGFYIGIGIVNLLHLLNPGRIVIGGGVSFAGDVLFKPIRETVSERAPAVYRQGVEIVPAALGDDAGLVGMAAIVFSGGQPA